MDDKALLKRLQKEVLNLRKQLTEMQDDSLQEEMKVLQNEKQRAEEDRSHLEKKLREQEEKISKFQQLIVVSSTANDLPSNLGLKSRRETWCPTVRSRDAEVKLLSLFLIER
jgi:hypothetical protein